MKRIILGLFSAIVLSLGFINIASADVNDFVITDFTADYYLSKDDNGHSLLRTVETITADFPVNQNHGIERALPETYDNHSTNLIIESITDENWNRLNYSTYDNNGNKIIRIGEADIYVSGLNTYIITYNQQDVTKYFADTNDDEFYWDVNGIEWTQSFDNVTARIHVSEDLANNLTDKQSCYFGADGSKNQCTITRTNNEFSAAKNNLGPKENLSISIGFNAKTFSRYTMTLWDYFKKYASILLTVLCIIFLVIIFYLRLFKYRSASGRGTIIPEYLPPSGVDVPGASIIGNYKSKWVAAVIIDLAVRKKIKIIEINSARLFKKANYKLELISTKNITENETVFLKSMFINNYNIGEFFECPNTSDTRLAASIESIYKKIKSDMESDGYFDKKTKIFVIMLVMSILVIFMFIIAMTLSVDNFGLQIVLRLIFIIDILFMSILFNCKLLTAKGSELSDHLKGLKLYIKIAEKDRIKFLQSPKGSEKTQIDTDSKELMVKLYEKVLPYAVLFGQEKEWAKVIGVYYEQQNISPVWYVGTGVFNIGSFSSLVSSFSSNMSSSSSTGGSSGGGSSGGGGGGGGGGGW